MNLDMAKGFKTGGRKKGSKNKPRELAVSFTERAATAGNARVHAKVIPALTVTPLEIMLENMNWAWDKANDLEHIIQDSNTSLETKLDALKEMVRLRDRAQCYAEKAAPYVHPKLHAVAPPPKQEEAAEVEVDPLREHLEEMAKVFRLKLTNGKAA
jgi:hypothetical protein